MSNTRLTFVIGDIHGMFDALLSILDGIDTYTSENNVKTKDYKIVFLGDYIDRGPASNQVVETIRLMQTADPERIITLRGNHEQMLMDAMNGGYDDVSLFRMNGGRETLKSYGVENEKDIPFGHKMFFRDTRYSYEDELRYYVHAGVAWGKPLSEQPNEVRLWIREGFLEHTEPFEKFIVHGHTPRPYDRPNVTNRLNMDFAAVFGGSLVCAIFNDTEVEPISFLKTGPLSRPMRP